METRPPAFPPPFCQPRPAFARGLCQSFRGEAGGGARTALPPLFPQTVGASAGAPAPRQLFHRVSGKRAACHRDLFFLSQSESETLSYGGSTGRWHLPRFYPSAPSGERFPLRPTRPSHMLPCTHDGCPGGVLTSLSPHCRPATSGTRPLSEDKWKELFLLPT